MKKLGLVFCALLFIGVAAQTSSAASISLMEVALNLDGTIYDSLYGPMPFPVNVNTAGFDFSTGLGSLTATITGMGAHTVIAFFDHEIDEAINTFYNEFGSHAGSPASGQSWEIDEPGYTYGDIFTNVTNNTLDNTNSVPGSAPDDVSMAIGWNFSLPDNVSVATVTFNLTTTSPGPSGFYLIQNDPDSQASVFFGSTMNIVGQPPPPNPIPEPGTVVLLITGLGVLGVIRYRKSA